MKRKSLLFFLLAAVSPLLAAETVLISIGASASGKARSEQPGPARLQLSALEDGIMDEFYKSGHIAFNAGFFTAGPAEKTALIRAAKEGGATRLLSVGLSYSGDAAGGAEKIDFSFLSVNDQRVLSAGSVDPADYRSPQAGSTEEFYAELGRAVAQKVLSRK